MKFKNFFFLFLLFFKYSIIIFYLNNRIINIILEIKNKKGDKNEV